MNDDLDPRWEWVEVQRFGDREPSYIKGQCHHLEVVPVETDGEVVAHLCLTCDAQLPAEWRLTMAWDSSRTGGARSRPTPKPETGMTEQTERAEVEAQTGGVVRGIILDQIASRVGQVASVHPRLLEGIEAAAEMLATHEATAEARGAERALREAADEMPDVRDLTQNGINIDGVHEWLDARAVRAAARGVEGGAR